ncbi:MAG TPA: hypothetical protein VI702_04530, partial [Nitrospiria bacterium]
MYTRSVTDETGAMLTNDNTLPYEGEDFEKVMVNILAALNYVSLAEWNEALVEARKVDHRLSLLNSRYEKKNIYKEDAFAQYLSGILYEGKGEYNDAFIAYRKAFEAYQKYKKEYGTPMPSTLQNDLLRMTAAVPLPEEHSGYLKQFPGAAWLTVKELKARAEVIFISFTGRSPMKEDFFVDAPIPEKNGVYHLRVALPRFVPIPNPVRTAEVHLIPSDGAKGNSGPVGAISQRGFLVEDITAIAKKNLEDRIGRITVKAIARATAKYLASQKVRSEVKKKSDGNPLSIFLADVGTNVYSIVSEQSDKRSWRTLPDSIRMARIAAPPGTYTIAVEYYDESNGLILRKEIQSVVLKAGEKKFLTNRVIGR